MLRLNPSQIHLEKRDLDWHVARHKQRQAANRELDSVTAERPLQSNPTIKVHSRRKRSPNYPQSAVSTKISASRDTYDDGALTSPQPVPRASKAFWDHVLTRAGAPLAAPPPVFANKLQLSTKKETASNFPSGRGVLQGTSISCADTSFDEAASPPQPDNETHVAQGMTCHSTLNSGSSSSATLSDNNSEYRTPIPPPDASSRAMMSRFTSLFQRRAKIDDESDIEDPLSSSHGLDGHVDPDATPQSLGSLYSPGHGIRTDQYNLPMARQQYGDMGTGHLPVNKERHLHHPQINVSSQQELQDFSYHEAHNTPKFASSIPPEAIPALYESHQGTSSVSTALQTTGLFDFRIPPGRRQITYRARSKTYSFTASEVSVGSINDSRVGRDLLKGGESPSDSSNERLSCAPIEQMMDMIPISHFIGNDDGSRVSPLPNHIANIPASRFSERPCQEYFGLGGTEAPDPRISSFNRDANFATSSSEAPLAISQSQIDKLRRYGAPNLHTVHSHDVAKRSNFVPSQNLNPPSRTPSAQLRLPPPFSNTLRVFSHISPPPTTPPVSASKSITPKQSPDTSSPHVSLGSHHQPPPSPSLNDLSSVPPAPRTPFMVYNDDNPPWTQPQTPADLDSLYQRRLRHGPTGQTPNPAYTAPAQLMGRSSTTVLPNIRDVRNRAQLVTPTRGPRGGGRAARRDGPEAENADAITEQEREWRRLWNGEVGSGMGRDERERLIRSPGL